MIFTCDKTEEGEEETDRQTEKLFFCIKLSKQESDGLSGEVYMT